MAWPGLAIVMTGTEFPRPWTVMVCWLHQIFCSEHILFFLFLSLYQ